MPKMVDLEKLSTLETEIKLLEGRISAKRGELENITKECNSLKDKTNKEIAQQKQLCDIECQEKTVKTDKLLKDTENKLKTIETREQDTKVIEGQIKELDKKTKAFGDTKKETEALRVSCIDREKKADLIIEQYSKKLTELEASKNKK